MSVLIRLACRPVHCPKVTSNLSFRNRHQSVQYSSAAKYDDTVDVAIVGGGPTGLMFASALGSEPRSDKPLTVALIESTDLNAVRDWGSPPIFSNRVFAITKDNIMNLESINAWSNIDKKRTQRVQKLQVWDGTSGGQIGFDSADLERSPDEIRRNAEAPWMICMMENSNLQRGLLKTVEAMKSAEIIDKTKVDAITRDSPEKGSWPIVSLSNGRNIRARLLVGADGFNSPVKSFAKITSNGWNYDAHAVVATLETNSMKYPSVAYQRFLSTGAIAFLPLSKNAASLVWSTNPRLAKIFRNLSHEDLALLINAAFTLPESSLDYIYSLLERIEQGENVNLKEEKLWRSQVSGQKSAEFMPIHSIDSFPNITRVQPGTVAGFPLRMFHAEEYLGDPIDGVSSRTALLGDAAHVSPPLAGQGLNMGLRGAAALACTVKNSRDLGLDIGLLTSLKDYPRKQYIENHVLLSGMDKIHKIHSSQVPLLVSLRTIILEVLNELQFAKNPIMRFAGAVGVNRSTFIRGAFKSAASLFDGAISAGRSSKILWKLWKNRVK